MLTLAVSIYNKEPYLPRCLDAMLAQTSSNYEILLIDDGSSDGSGALCDRYAAAHPDQIRCIHKPNNGLAQARNTGIDAARGRWITFPDPDDWVEPDYVATFLELLECSQADLVCTGYWVDSAETRYPGYPDGPTVTMTAREARRSLLLPPRICGFAWNKVYDLDLVRRCGLRFRSDVGAVEDMEFTYRYLEQVKSICYCPSRLTYHYDQHPDSITNSGFSRRNLNDFKTYALLAEDEDPELVQAARDQSCVTAVNHLWSLLESGSTDLQSKQILCSHIRRNLRSHLESPLHSRRRKLQALTAAVSPRLFVFLKATARRLSSEFKQHSHQRHTVGTTSKRGTCESCSAHQQFQNPDL